jgi:drug/metabolite transporter (DMT)-like permease
MMSADPASPSPQRTDPAQRTGAIVPTAFVLLWSTGFIGAKFGLPYAEPMTFLAVRMVIVTGLLGVAAVVMRAPWPGDWRMTGHIVVAGLLVHGVYLGCVFAAIASGLPAGTSALVVGLQPILTAVLVGPLLGERLDRRQWVGLFLGFVGVVLVVWEKIALRDGMAAGLALSAMALVGITLGTLYQKRYCAGLDLRSGATIQYGACALAFTALAFALEERTIAWTGEFVFALAWLCLALSVGAVLLLFALIRRGSASGVASLFYLVPPVTAATAFVLFGESLGLLALIGMVFAAAGVALVNRPK